MNGHRDERAPRLVLRGTALGRRATGAATHALLLHGIEFLLLVVGQDSLDAVVGAFGDGAHLGAAIFLRERLILEEGLHLLLPLDEEGLDLCLLVGSQAEFAGESLKLPVGIHAHPAATLGWAGLILIWGWGWVVLGQSGAAGAES